MFHWKTVDDGKDILLSAPTDTPWFWHGNNLERIKDPDSTYSPCFQTHQGVTISTAKSDDCTSLVSTYKGVYNLGDNDLKIVEDTKKYMCIMDQSLIKQISHARVNVCEGDCNGKKKGAPRFGICDGASERCTAGKVGHICKSHTDCDNILVQKNGTPLLVPGPIQPRYIVNGRCDPCDKTTPLCGMSNGANVYDPFDVFLKNRRTGSEPNNAVVSKRDVRGKCTGDVYVDEFGTYAWCASQAELLPERYIVRSTKDASFAACNQLLKLGCGGYPSLYTPHLYET